MVCWEKTIFIIIHKYKYIVQLSRSAVYNNKKLVRSHSVDDVQKLALFKYQVFRIYQIVQKIWSFFVLTYPNIGWFTLKTKSNMYNFYIQEI